MKKLRKKLPEELSRVVSPIVEGQIRDYIAHHPEILRGVVRYKPEEGQATTLVNGLAKRIVRDLLCESVLARLKKALLEPDPDGLDKSG